MKKLQTEWEIVLPVSGRFAKVRPLLMKDVFSRNVDTTLMGLIAATVLIDGEKITVDDVGEMEMEEARPLLNRITKQMGDTNSKGIA